MNTFKLSRVGALLLSLALLSGCAVAPYQNGYYGPGFDMGRIAGAGTGAALGAMAGAVVGNPLAGAAIGATFGGMTSSYGPVVAPVYPQGSYYPQQQPYYQQQQQQQVFVPPPPPPPSVPPDYIHAPDNPRVVIEQTCKEKYDYRVQVAKTHFENKYREIEQFGKDTGNSVDTSVLLGNLKSSYPAQLKNAEIQYLQCVGAR